MKYEHLFSPIKINNTMLKNRIVAAPVGEEYKDKALGGAALVVCGHTIVEEGRSSFASGNEKSAFYKYEVERTREKIRVCHAGGAKASIEIFHAGLYARVNPGDHAWGPCAFTRDDGVEVWALDEEKMEYIADLYAKETLEARNLGFDAAFLHFGHGWLPAQFISPLFNHREDEYGGSIENRAKFPLLILKKIRQAVGPGFMLDMRISGEECVPGSIKFEDTLAFILMAEEYIDSVQISAGLDINHEGNARLVAMNYVEHMPNLKWAKVVKEKAKKIKVSVVGSVNTPAEADQIIKDGLVDFVAFGRSFNADPYWPRKAMCGHDEDITPCVRCNQCYHITTNRRNVGCTVNPRYHNENIISAKVEKTDTPKKVVIIGAGPAGIQCALTASERGHKVILLEKNSEAGGTMKLISKEHYKADIAYYCDHIVNKLKRSDVDVRYNFEATPENVKELNPDALVIAVGGYPLVLPIKGVDKKHVYTYEQVIGHEDMLGDKPLIVGGGTIGTEIAIELSDLYHKDVTIVELTANLAPQANALYKIALRHKYESLEKPLTINLESRVEEIRDNDVLVKMKDGSVKAVEADCVILCTGVRSNRKLAESFYGITPETYEIGDVVMPRLIQEANFEGRGVGQNI
ncbi:MAG: FAD-dependent oxidoreductase [Erysipelotrichaceae bacterium]|nr:FAD-dependent oxidoreductase [Erysipelotrichaceae bacterium]